MKNYLLAGLALFSLPAFAGNTNANRQIIPIGESESFLGNTGTGRAHDTGAVYFNPSGLAELSSSRVSMTGSVYLSFSTQTDALLRVDNTDVGYQASGFNTIPAFYVATYRFEESWNGAFSVLVPNSLQLENRMPFTTPNTKSNIIQDYRSSDLWLGLSLAHRLDERWSVGATVFGIQHQEAQTIALDALIPAASTSSLTTALTQQKLSTLGLSAVLGAGFHATDWLELGFRAQTPLVQLSGSADTFRSIHSITGGVITTTGEDKTSSAATYQIPFDFTFGTAFTPSDWFAFLADLSLQLGAKYDSIPGSALSESVNLMPAARLNFGLEFKPSRYFPVRVGFYYNPSANGSDATQPGYISEDYLGVTAGVGLNSSKVETGVGAFYIWSTGRAVPAGGAVGTPSGVHSRGVGALLTASYLL